MIFVINQLDHEKANFEQTLEHAQASFGKKVVLVQYPVNQGLGFNQVVDVLKMEMYQWKPEGGKPDVLPIPESEKEKADELHNALIEAAENDEGLMELYFEKGSLSEDEMRAGIRKGLIARDMFPVFCVSAEKDMCVRRFMEFLVKILAKALVARQGHGQLFCQAGSQRVHEEGIELFGVFNVGYVAHGQRRAGGVDAPSLHFPFRAFHIQHAQAVRRQGELIGCQGVGRLSGDGVQRGLRGGEGPARHAEGFPPCRVVMKNAETGCRGFIGNQRVQRSLPYFGECRVADVQRGGSVRLK